MRVRRSLSAGALAAVTSALSNKLGAQQPAGCDAPDLLAVASRTDHGVRLVDLRAQRVIASLATGRGPHEIAVSSDGRTLFAANMGVFPDGVVGGTPQFRRALDSTVSLIDLRTRRVMGHHTIRGIRGPHGVAVSSDGRWLWVTAEEQNAVAEVDAISGRVVTTWQTSHAPHMVVASADDKRLYLANTSDSVVTVIDRASGSMKSIPTGRAPEGMAFRPGSRELWVANRGTNTLTIIDASRDSAVARMPAGGSFPTKLAFAPDGRTVWVAHNASNTVGVVDADQRRIVATIPLGTQPLGIAIAPNGRLVAVSAPRTGEVIILDSHRRTIACRLSVGRDADGVAWYPRQGPTTALAGGDDRYLRAATGIASWLGTIHGDSTWPEDARRPGVSPNLADGVAGITLFLAELYRASRNPDHGREMRRGADWLVRALPAEMSRGSAFPPRTSFYYGAPGMAFVLERVYQLTGHSPYRDSALGVVRWLRTEAADSGWTSFNDVLFGDAGTALYLLFAARAYDDSASRQLAASVGRRLVRRAREEHGGLTWVVREGQGSMLPNFSHGAAGIGFLLSTLYAETGSHDFRLAAERTAAYLLAIGNADSGAFRIPYGTDRPEWRERYEVGWAHGAAGSARFFERLAESTGDSSWRRYVRAADRAIRRAGIPGDSGWSSDTATIGWDRRFGLAGIADFQLDLNKAMRDARALQSARLIADYLLSRASNNQRGRLHWVEQRPAFMVDAGAPGELTGLLHGAAGYGLLMVRLDAAIRQRPWTLQLPDTPY